MLNRRYRFHSRGGVRFVQKNGKTVRGGKMALVLTPNNRGFTRVGVVVSKKVDKRAVVRNRIRRRVYEAVRVKFDELPRKTDYIIMVYSKEVEREPFLELSGTILKLVEEGQEMIKAE